MSRTNSEVQHDVPCNSPARAFALSIVHPSFEEGLRYPLNIVIGDLLNTAMIRKEEGKSTDSVKIEMILSYIYTSMYILLGP